MSAMPATAGALRPDLRVVPDEPVAAPAPSHLIVAPDEAHERVARALRGARARTGLGEQQVVDKLAGIGVEIDLIGLRRAESAGAIDLALASALADLYGTTTDCLAGRRIGRQAVHPTALRI
jgi:hypothetical protein